MNSVEQTDYDAGVSHVIDAYGRAAQAYDDSEDAKIRNLADGLCTTLQMALSRLLPKSSKENQNKFNLIFSTHGKNSN